MDWHRSSACDRNRWGEQEEIKKVVHRMGCNGRCTGGEQPCVDHRGYQWIIWKTSFVPHWSGAFPHSYPSGSGADRADSFCGGNDHDDRIWNSLGYWYAREKGEWECLRKKSMRFIKLCKRVVNEVPTANASFNYSIYGMSVCGLRRKEDVSLPEGKFKWDLYQSVSFDPFYEKRKSWKSQ